MKFARQFPGMQLVFPGSSQEQVYPTETNDFIQPVVEVPARAVRLREAGTFQITTAAGVTPVFTTLNDRLVVYYDCIAFLFTEAAASRRMFASIRQGSAGQAVALYDSAADVQNFPGGLVPEGVAICLRRIVQPPNHRIEMNVVGMGAGGTATIEGTAVVLGLSDPAPPLFG